MTPKYGIFLLAALSATQAHALDGSNPNAQVPSLENSEWMRKVKATALQSSETVQKGQRLAGIKDQRTQQYEAALLRRLQKKYPRLNEKDAAELDAILHETDLNKRKALLKQYAQQRNLPTDEFVGEAEGILASDPTLSDPSSLSGGRGSSGPSGSNSRSSALAAAGAAKQGSSNQGIDPNLKSAVGIPSLATTGPDFKVGAASRPTLEEPKPISIDTPSIAQDSNSDVGVNSGDTGYPSSPNSARTSQATARSTTPSNSVYPGNPLAGMSGNAHSGGGTAYNRSAAPLSAGNNATPTTQSSAATSTATQSASPATTANADTNQIKLAESKVAELQNRLDYYQNMAHKLEIQAPGANLKSSTAYQNMQSNIKEAQAQMHQALKQFSVDQQKAIQSTAKVKVAAHAAKIQSCGNFDSLKNALSNQSNEKKPTYTADSINLKAIIHDLFLKSETYSQFSSKDACLVIGNNPPQEIRDNLRKDLIDKFKAIECSGKSKSSSRQPVDLDQEAEFNRVRYEAYAYLSGKGDPFIFCKSEYGPGRLILTAEKGLRSVAMGCNNSFAQAMGHNKTLIQDEGSSRSRGFDQASNQIKRKQAAQKESVNQQKLFTDFINQQNASSSEIPFFKLIDINPQETSKNQKIKTITSMLGLNKIPADGASWADNKSDICNAINKAYDYIALTISNQKFAAREENADTLNHDAPSTHNSTRKSQ